MEEGLLLGLEVWVCGKRICRKGGGEGEREGARAVAASKYVSN
jgi:hypothetical protein